MDAEILARSAGSHEKRLLERVFISLFPGDFTAGSNVAYFYKHPDSLG